MGNSQSTLCVKLDDELYHRVQERCEAEGLRVSEAMRSLIEQWLDQQLPTVSAGYAQARGAAVQLVHFLVDRVADEIPESYEELLALAQGLNPAFRRKGG